MNTVARLAPSQGRMRLQLLADSAALRTELRRALAATPYALTPEIVGRSDAARAVDETRPDCLVLDTELPGLQGLALLRQIVEADPELPIIVVAPDTVAGRKSRAEALERGALGVVLKPEADQPLAYRPVAEAVLELLETRLQTKPSRVPLATQTPASSAAAAPRVHRRPPQVIVVTSSTGGPQALIRLFSEVPPSAVNVPVLVVQHMPAAFTPILAEHITRATPWRAAEARPDEPLTRGEIRIAPGGRHMLVCNAAGTKRLRLTETAPVNFSRPSADVLFVSAAEAFGRGVLGVILTGMGNDGCQGAKAIAAAGGVVYAQDRDSSVVWGMPGAAVGAGVVDRVYPLASIAPAIRSAMAGVV